MVAGVREGEAAKKRRRNEMVGNEVGGELVGDWEDVVGRIISGFERKKLVIDVKYGRG